MILADIAEYVTDKISSNDVSLNNYVTTDSLLQNKRGRECAQNLPPMPCALIHFQPKDILIANIRPYLKRFGLPILKEDVRLTYLFLELKKDISQTFICDIDARRIL